MIRMILIYTGLFIAAAGALWLRPDAGDVASAPVTLTGITDTTLQSASLRPQQRPSQYGLDVLPDDVVAKVESGQRQRGIASLIVQRLEQDSTGATIEALVADNDGALDLAPLLDVPGSVRTEDGTRILASALMRRDAVSASAFRSEVTGIATLSAGPDPEPTAVEERFYTVKAGDSLGTIAAEFYGSSASYREIYQANRDILRSIDSVRVGQRLRLP